MRNDQGQPIAAAGGIFNRRLAVEFSAKLGRAGQASRPEKLISWTGHPNAGVRYFSGTASYEKEIEIPADRLSRRTRALARSGPGERLCRGIPERPGFRRAVETAVPRKRHGCGTPGPNKLVVKVTNLWPNRLIGDEQLPPDCEWQGKQLKEWPQWLLEGKPSPTGRLTFTTWHHYTKDSPLLESGLLGPVTLRTAEMIPVN